MSAIRRWDGAWTGDEYPPTVTTANGRFVLFTDHEAEVARAVEAADVKWREEVLIQRELRAEFGRPRRGVLATLRALVLRRG